MEYRRVGRTGLRVSQMCLGTMQFGWTTDKSTAFKVMDKALEMGCNFLDTADIYSNWHEGNHGGESETIIGNWLALRKPERDDLVIATKVRGKIGVGPNAEGLTRKHIIRAVHRSLERLQTDHIDLYQVHWPDDDTSLEETLMAMESLVRSGVVHYIGCSNYPAWLLGQSLTISSTREICRFETVQPHYNLVHRAEFERELQPLCLDQKIGALPYSPLAGGFLTGKYRRNGPFPASARASRIQRRHMNDRGFSLVEKLSEIGLEYEATCGQVAISWTLANPAVSSVIIGANSVDQLVDTFRGTKINLSAKHKANLDELTAWE